jgi:hypothetical protein
VIRNPNDIVDRLVTGFCSVAGGHLLGVTMYGGAVSHEYRPGKSEVNILVVLDDTSADVLSAFVPVQTRWMRRGMSAPLYLTPAAIASLPDVFPMEFLDMRHAYRVLYGEDFLADRRLDRNDLRLQSKRELAGLALHLRLEFVRTCRHPRRLRDVLALSLRRLHPVFKAILVLYEKKIPSPTAELIAAVEDLSGLGPSVLSEMHNHPRLPETKAKEYYERFLRAVELLTGQMDRLRECPAGGVTAVKENHN